MIKIFGDTHLILNSVVDEPIFRFWKKNIDKNDIIVFCGDTFDTFDIGLKHHKFYDFISKYPNKIFLLTGNHDFSRERCGLNILNPFSKNINVIKEYEYFDINDKYRFHFYNYFKKIRKKFELDKNKQNILITHCDLDVDNPFVEFKQFDLILNGHIHDYQRNGKFINIGAVRQCAINEVKEKKYFYFDIDADSLDLKCIDFKSVVDIKQCFVHELKDVQIERNTILKVLFTGYQDAKDIMKKIRALDWYDECKVIIKFEQYIDESVLNDIITDINGVEKIDLEDLFDKYIQLYVDKFKAVDLNKKLLKSTFNSFYKKEYEQLKELFNLYNIKFGSIKVNNFKLFKDMKMGFSDYNDIVGIIGSNYDEIDKFDEPSSNESGKSCVRNAIEYAILGSGSNIKPLRWGEKSGYVELKLNINDDNIIINRKFLKSINDITITINNVDFYPNETPSDRMSMFFEKYKIMNAIQFIFVSDTGMARYFFSSRNSEKFKIFKSIFPIIEHISNFVCKIKEDAKDKEMDFLNLHEKKQEMEKLRKLKALIFFNSLWDIRKEEVELKDVQILKELSTIHVDDALLVEKENINFIYNLLDDNIIKAYELYEKKYDVKVIFNECEKNIEIINQIKIEESKKGQFEKQIVEQNSKKQMVEDKIINADKKTNSEFDMNLIKHDLYKIKDMFFKFKIFDNIIEKYSQIDNFVEIFSDSLFKEYHISTGNVENIKNKLDVLKIEYSKLNKRKEDIENGEDIINCPKCGNEFIDNKKFNTIEQDLVEITNTGKKLKKELNDKNIKNEFLYKKYDENKKIEGDIVQILDGVDISHTQFIDYTKNAAVYKERIKEFSNYSIEDIDKMIAYKKEYEIVESNLIYLEEQKKEYTDSVHKLSTSKCAAIEKIKEYSGKLKDVDNKIYDEIIKILKDLEMSKTDYLVCENNIKNVLDKNIILDLKKESVDVFVRDYVDKLVEQEKLDNKQKELQIQLKYEKEKRIKLEKSFEKLLEDIKCSKKELSLKEINDELKIKEIIYKNANLLYKIMTAKRTFNFENFFINNFFKYFQDIFNMLLSVLFERGVNMNIDDQNFNFVDNGRKDIAFTEFSNGAKTKIEFSLMVAINILFSKYGTHSDMLFLDEFLDKGADLVNIGRMMMLLQKFFCNKKVFVVSHKNIDDFVSDKLEIIRKDGVSKINK